MRLPRVGSFTRPRTLDRPDDRGPTARVGARLPLELIGLPLPRRSAVRLGDAHWSQAPTTGQCINGTGLACYRPSQFQEAYDLQPLYRGSPRTAAGRPSSSSTPSARPTIRGDLATFERPPPAGATELHGPAAGRQGAAVRPEQRHDGRLGGGNIARRRSTPMPWRPAEHRPRRDAGGRDRGRRRAPADHRGRELRHQPPPR